MAGASNHDEECGEPGLVVGGASAGRGDESFENTWGDRRECEDSEGEDGSDKTMVGGGDQGWERDVGGFGEQVVRYEGNNYRYN